MVQEFGFDEVQDLIFNDDHLFSGRSIEAFMDDMSVGLPSEIDNDQCFDVELPFDMSPLMQCEVKEELDFVGSE